jgi:enamine deaminase RidA (YjgF/YER057c/UK114 family)
MRDQSCQWPQIEKLRLPLKKQDRSRRRLCDHGTPSTNARGRGTDAISDLRVAFETCGRATKLDAILDYREHSVVPFASPAFARRPPMRRISAVLLAILLSSAAHAAEYMEKTPFQFSRAFSPGVITSGGTIVWVAGQTATQDSQGNNIANNFEAQVKQVFAQIDGIMKRAGGSLDNVVT